MLEEKKKQINVPSADKKCLLHKPCLSIDTEI